MEEWRRFIEKSIRRRVEGMKDGKVIGERRGTKRRRRGTKKRKKEKRGDKIKVIE
jgi:hypothetical protein